MCLNTFFNTLILVRLNTCLNTLILVCLNTCFNTLILVCLNTCFNTLILVCLNTCFNTLILVCLNTCFNTLILVCLNCQTLFQPTRLNKVWLNKIWINTVKLYSIILKSWSLIFWHAHDVNIGQLTKKFVIDVLILFHRFAHLDKFLCWKCLSCSFQRSFEVFKVGNYSIKIRQCASTEW